MDSINGICIQRKADLHLSDQSIASLSGLSESTVRNFLSEHSKQPSVYTVGPICAALGVSLDQYFNIPPGFVIPATGDKKQFAHDLNMEIIRVKELYGVSLDRIKALRRIVTALLALCLLLATFGLAYLLYFDLSNPNYGLFRG